jgi:hypothetical protein
MSNVQVMELGDRDRKDRIRLTFDNMMLRWLA